MYDGFWSTHHQDGHPNVGLNGRDILLDYDPTTIDWAAGMSAHLATKRVFLAFLTWLLWDLVTSLEQSINLFWRHRWSVSKILFLINQFNGILLMLFLVAQIFTLSPSEQYCRVAPWLQIASSAILIATINCILLLRVYALWNRSRWIFALCFTASFLNVASYIIIMSYSFSISTYLLPALPPFTGCVLFPGFAKAYVVFVTSIAFETLVIILTVIKVFPVIRHYGTKATLYNLLLEDGVAYYCLITCSQILNLISVFQFSTVTTILFGAYPAIVVTVFAGNRLLLRPQRVLLSNGSQMPTEYITEDHPTVTPSIRGPPKNTIDSFLSRDLPGERLEMNDRRKDMAWGTASRLTKKRPSLLLVDGHRQAGSIQPTSPVSQQLSGSLDKEIDLSGQYLQGIIVEREDVQRIDGELATPGVLIPTELPFSYGSRSNVLDPGATTTQDNSALRISRIGRYD